MKRESSSIRNGSRLKNRLHTRLIVFPSFRRGLRAWVYDLDSFLCRVCRETEHATDVITPLETPSLSHRRFLHSIVPCRKASDEVESLVSLPLLVGGQRWPPFVRNSSRIHGSTIRQQEEDISVWLPLPAPVIKITACIYIGLREIMNTVSFNFPTALAFHRSLSFFCGSNGERKRIA